MERIGTGIPICTEDPEVTYPSCCQRWVFSSIGYDSNCIHSSTGLRLEIVSNAYANIHNTLASQYLNFQVCKPQDIIDLKSDYYYSTSETFDDPELVNNKTEFYIDQRIYYRASLKPITDCRLYTLMVKTVTLCASVLDFDGNIVPCDYVTNQGVYTIYDSDKDPSLSESILWRFRIENRGECGDSVLLSWIVRGINEAVIEQTITVNWMFYMKASSLTGRDGMIIDEPFSVKAITVKCLNSEWDTHLKMCIPRPNVLIYGISILLTGVLLIIILGAMSIRPRLIFEYQTIKKKKAIR